MSHPGSLMVPMGQKRTYKVKKHQWEKDLPKPQTSKEVLRQVILSKISYFQSKTTAELHQEVMDDYGNITERSLYRYLKELKASGKVKSVYNWDFDVWAYLRSGDWRKKKPVKSASNDNIYKKAA